jgi:hypothetical protein
MDCNCFGVNRGMPPVLSFQKPGFDAMQAVLITIAVSAALMFVLFFVVAGVNPGQYRSMR